MKRISLLLSPILAVLLAACDGSGSSSNDTTNTQADAFFFSATKDTNSGFEPWISNGTTDGTRLIKDINDAGSSYPVRAVFLNGQWIFGAYDDANGFELWASDGTSAGTYMLKNIHPEGSADVSYLTLFKGKAYFSAQTTSNGYELWVTDGTEAGTRLFKDISPGHYDSTPSELVVSGDYLYFSAAGYNEGRELWVTDGTEAGTRMINILSGVGSSMPSGLTPFNGKVVFAAYAANSSSNSEFYVADANSATLIDINPGSDSSYPRGFTVVGNTVFFSAETNASGRELWKSDGVTATMVKDMTAGSGDSNIDNKMVSFNGKLYFSASTGGYQYLWESNGTSAGTFALKGEPAGNVDILGATSEKIFFSAYNTIYSRELWSSDGTASGTDMVKDINPGNAAGSPNFPLIFKDKLFFTANDGTHGNELWVSDGSEAGTVMVKDIYPDGSSSNPRAELSPAPVK